MSIVINDLNLKTKKTDEFTFQDLDIHQPNTSKNSLELYDIDAIRNSINNIFLIKKGSRILYPDFGSNLDEFLFETLDTENAKLLGESIEDTLKQETRIVVDTVEVQIDPTNSQYLVSILFSVPSTTTDVFRTNININQNTGIAINNTRLNN